MIVQNIQTERLSRLVYNLHLSSKAHTFFAEGVLVHNAESKVAPAKMEDIRKLPDLGKQASTDLSTQPGCVFSGPRRQQLIQEITDAVEARLLVTLVQHHEEAGPESAGSHGAVVVRPVFGSPLEVRDLRCDVFMMMPFAEGFQSIYQDYIRPVVLAASLEIRRADDFFSQHNIIDEIWTALCVCRFAIADCTGRNPNVLYELGIAHTLGKRVILLAQDPADIPFDVQGRRVILYQDRSSGLKYLQQELRRVIDRLIAEQ